MVCDDRRPSESYQGTGAEATQSAIDLSRLDDIVAAVDALAARLLAGLRSRELEAAVHDAWRRPLRFFENFYVDIHDFARNLAAATGARDVKSACAEVQHAVEGHGAKSPINAEAHGGARLRAANRPVDLLPTVPRSVGVLPGSRLRAPDAVG